MASAKFNINGKEHSSELKKVNRSDIYGDTITKVLGEGDQPLQKAGVSENGKDYLTSGDLKYAVTAAEDFTLAPVKTINPLTGEPAVQIPSSLTTPPEFVPATADQLAQLEVTAVYHLPDLQLDPGSKYIGAFNYRAGYEKKSAALVGRPDGSFLLIGQEKPATFVGMEVDSQLIAAEETQAEESGDGDFSSLF